MVESKKRPPEVCLDWHKPIARQYEDRDVFEEVTQPDLSPSLYSMVTTQTVGSMPGNSPNYVFQDIGDDDEEGHSHPDYGKLGTLDPIERENVVNSLVDNFETNFNEKEKDDRTEGAPENAPSTASPETSGEA